MKFYRGQIPPPKGIFGKSLVLSEGADADWKTGNLLQNHLLPAGLQTWKGKTVTHYERCSVPAYWRKDISYCQDTLAWIIKICCSWKLVSLVVAQITSLSGICKYTAQFIQRSIVQVDKLYLNTDMDRNQGVQPKKKNIMEFSVKQKSKKKKTILHKPLFVILRCKNFQYKWF